MMNQFLELHDSDIAEITRHVGYLLIAFSVAYIYISDGDVEVDPTKVYLQQAELRVVNGQISDMPSTWPLTIADGDLILEGQVFPNSIPLPLEYRGKTELSLTLWGESFSGTVDILGDGASVVLIGTPRYLQDA